MSQNQQPAGSVLVYADYVCPFCYLGYASLDQYRGQRSEPIAADWHPFDLRAQKRRPDGTIDHDVDDGKDDEYFEQARGNVRRLAERYDVEMAQELAREVDSLDAQRVAYRAKETHPESFEAFHRGVFDALWEEGEDIEDPEVLESIAEAAGLPSGFVAETLEDESTAEAVEAAFETAQKRGVSGVPTFVYGEHAARGAVPPAQLRRLIDGE